MAVVSFKNEAGWVVARWAFNRLLEDIEQGESLDVEVVKVFKQARALDGLHLGLIKPSVSRRILYVMRKTVQELLDDTSEMLRKELDEEGYQMYREGLPELLQYIEENEEESNFSEK
jgi:hypothetical protein